MNNFNLKRFIQIALASVIGFVCLYIVISRFDWSQIWVSAGKVNFIFFFFTASLTLLGCFFLRTLRWKLLLRGEDVEIPFSKLYLYSAIAIGISTITPFQSGEALKVELLRKHGGKRLSGYAIFFLERIFDLFAVVGLAIIGTSFGLDFGVERVYLFLIASFLIIAFSIVIILIIFLPSERLLPIRIWIKENWQKKWNLLAAFGLTVFAWMAVIYGWKFVLAFFTIDIDLLQAVSLVTLTTLITILSFVPGAIGVSELSVSIILSGMGIETTLAQTGAVAIRLYALVILILTLLHWLYFKFIYKKV